MQPSRRAFLSGRRPPPSVWEHFCRRLRGACDGTFDDLGAATGVGRAHFVPAGSGDMALAVSLAREYGVVLALAGAADDVVDAPADRPAMHIDASLLDGLTPVDAVRTGDEAESGVPLAWDVQPGCRLSALAAVGLRQFANAPRDITLAQWLAAPHPQLAPGLTSASGIVAVDALFADGTFEALGPFGADATQPLQSATVQALIPKLFHIAASDDAQACRAQASWQPAYRLDALLPQAPHTVNLGQLVLGHGGTLLWVCSVRLRDTGTPLGEADVYGEAGVYGEADVHGKAGIQGTADVYGEVPDRDAAERLVRRIKSTFDPGEQFPMFG